jgi:hypothetical protein
MSTNKLVLVIQQFKPAILIMKKAMQINSVGIIVFVS